MGVPVADHGRRYTGHRARRSPLPHTFAHENIFRLGAGMSGLLAARFQLLVLLMKNSHQSMYETRRCLSISKPSGTTHGLSDWRRAHRKGIPTSMDSKGYHDRHYSQREETLREFSTSYRSDVKTMLSAVPETRISGSSAPPSKISGRSGSKILNCTLPTGEPKDDTHEGT